MKEDKVRLLIFSTWGLLFISLFIHLGLQPLRMEEPRRALVALEMDLQENWVVPTLYGEPYYNKPPVWNWMILSAAKISGSYSEFAIRFFAVLSLFLTGLLAYWMGKTYVSELFGHASALFLLMGVELYFVASQLGEIDLFYTLITFSQFCCIFHFYQKRNFFLLFLGSYTLAAVGLLTKGLPSLVFQGVSIFVFFLYQRDWKKLFSFPHIVGIASLILLVSGYLMYYQTFNAMDGFVDRIWTESRDRTLLVKGYEELVLHFFRFPLETLASILPASLLIPFIIRSDFTQKLKDNPYILFCGILFLANILIYWFSPGTRQRYIYPLYPLIVSLLVYFTMEHGYELPQTGKVINILLGIVVVAVPLLSLAVPFVPELAPISYTWVLAGAGFVIGALLFYFFIRQPSLRWLSLVMVFVLVRIIYSLSVFPVRSLPDGDTQKEKDYAIYLNRLAGGAPISMLEGVKLPYRMGFYLSREMDNVLGYVPDSVHRGYVIAYPAQVKDIPHEEITEFFDKENKRYVLVELRPSP